MTPDTSYDDGVAEGYHAALNDVDKNEFLRGFNDGWAEAKGEIAEDTRPSHQKRTKITETSFEPKEDVWQ